MMELRRRFHEWFLHVLYIPPDIVQLLENKTSAHLLTRKLRVLRSPGLLSDYPIRSKRHNSISTGSTEILHYKTLMKIGAGGYDHITK